MVVYIFIYDIIYDYYSFIEYWLFSLTKWKQGLRKAAPASAKP